MAGTLEGRRILLVEDSPVVSTYTVDVLEELGCRVVGPAQNMAAARELAKDAEMDAAVIDIRIRGEKSFPICEILSRRNIPFILTSGYADWPIPDQWSDTLQLPKPFKLDDMEAALAQLFS